MKEEKAESNNSAIDSLKEENDALKKQKILLNK